MVCGVRGMRASEEKQSNRAAAHVNEQLTLFPLTPHRRLLGEPCSGAPDGACAPGLQCTIGMQSECAKIPTCGQGCNAANPCEPGCECHPYVQKCAHVPR